MFATGIASIHVGINSSLVSFLAQCSLMDAIRALLQLFLNESRGVLSRVKVHGIGHAKDKDNYRIGYCIIHEHGVECVHVDVCVMIIHQQNVLLTKHILSVKVFKKDLHMLCNEFFSNPAITWCLRCKHNGITHSLLWHGTQTFMDNNWFCTCTKCIYTFCNRSCGSIFIGCWHHIFMSHADYLHVLELSTILVTTMFHIQVAIEKPRSCVQSQWLTTKFCVSHQSMSKFYNRLTFPTSHNGQITKELFAGMYRSFLNTFTLKIFLGNGTFPDGWP